MDDAPKPPKILANKVIKQIVDHTLGGELVIEANDYAALRVAFRSRGGSWMLLGDGDIRQMNLLKEIVTAWGQMPDRKKTTDWVI